MAITITENVSSTSAPPETPIGPLASLYNNRYTIQTYAYPRDVGASYKGHAVEFTFLETHGAGIGTIASTIAAAAAVQALPAASAGAGALAGAAAQAVTKSLAVGAIVGVGTGLAALAGGTAYAATNIEESKNALTGATTGITFQPPTNRTSNIVKLYMPDTLEFEYKSDYNDLALGDVAGQSALAGLGGRAITSVFSDNMVKLALNKAGYVFNPQQQLLFNGIDFRSYTMSFTFTPYSQNEANEVKRIIQLFRQYAAPTVVTESAGFFFNPPGMVELRYLFNDQENKNLHKLKRSVIQSVQVNYSPNGWSAMKDGMPTQTTMTVDFKEVELVDSASIKNGY